MLIMPCDPRPKHNNNNNINNNNILFKVQYSKKFNRIISKKFNRLCLMGVSSPC